MMGWGWMPFYGLFPALFLVAVVVGLFALVRGGGRERPPGGLLAGPRRSAGLEVLDERYAKGEIAREEYLQKKADIRGDGGAPAGAGPA